MKDDKNESNIYENESIMERKEEEGKMAKDLHSSFVLYRLRFNVVLLRVHRQRSIYLVGGTT